MQNGRIMQASKSNHAKEKILDTADCNNDGYALVAHVEKRLRAPFSAPYFTKEIIDPRPIGLSGSDHRLSSRGGNGIVDNGSRSSSLSSSLSPSSYIRAITRSFERMDVPTRLGVLVSLLGLDPGVGGNNKSDDRNKNNNSIDDMNDDDEDAIKSLALSNDFDESLWELLERAGNDKEVWVKEMAGIIEEKMFTVSCGEECGQSRVRSNEINIMVERILDQVVENSTSNRDNDTNYGRNESNPSASSKSIGPMLAPPPTFLCWRYSVSSPSLLKRSIPELSSWNVQKQLTDKPEEGSNYTETDKIGNKNNVNQTPFSNKGSSGGSFGDLSFNVKSSILAMDAMGETKRAQEENLEENNMKKINNNNTNGNNNNSNINNSNKSRRGEVSLGGGKAAAIVKRTSQASTSVTPTSFGGRGGREPLPKSSVSVEPSARIAAPRRRGLGRGAAANAVGGKSLHITRPLGGSREQRPGSGAGFGMARRMGRGVMKEASSSSSLSSNTNNGTNVRTLGGGRSMTVRTICLIFVSSFIHLT